MLSVDSENKQIVFSEGVYTFKDNVVFPVGYSVIFKAGTTLIVDAGKSILIRKGDLTAKGTRNNPVKVIAKEDKKAFGVFAVLGATNAPVRVELDYFQLAGGSEKTLNNVFYSGQLTIVNADVSIKNSSFKYSKSDDGINVKYSSVDIRDTVFSDNIGDQIDLDFCDFYFINNQLEVSLSADKDRTWGSDGLDLSGSNGVVYQNRFSRFGDKGISVGEQTNVRLCNNKVVQSRIGIAVKDGSIAKMSKNSFENNDINLSTYIKKKFYSLPKVYAHCQNFLADGSDIDNCFELENYNVCDSLDAPSKLIH